MIQRMLEGKIKEQLRKFPVVAITGPRQSGKTTLAKKVAPKYEYYNLENITTKRFALSDPVGFIHSVGDFAIIDEIQKVPQLLSQIQVTVDETKRDGQFIITGSESLLLSEKISQSLAGRVANNVLLPLSYLELAKAKMQKKRIHDQILHGFYPRLYDSKQTPIDFYPEYLATYVEKDVRQMQNIGNLALFEKFLQLLAGRVGQLLNMSSLSNDVGVSHTTIEQWISLLEASYIVYRLQPYFVNIGKRLIKSPKIYFYDTGILTSLLGIGTSRQLAGHYAYGSIFENFVITEVQKHIYNNKLRAKLFFYRNSNGEEIDLMVDLGTEKFGVEIKAAETYSPDFLKGLKSFQKTTPTSFKRALFYNGSYTQKVGDFEIYNLNTLEKLVRRCTGG